MKEKTTTQPWFFYFHVACKF